MRKLIIITFILPLCFLACKSGKHAKEIKTIDSLYTVIDTIEKNLNSADTIKVKDVFEEYMKNIGQIRDCFNDKKGDTTWKIITPYGIIRKPLKNFLNDYSGLYKEIRYSRKQLDNLKADIEGENIQKDTISEYTINEVTSVNRLKQIVNFSVDGVQKNLKLFDSLNPKVIQLIEQLKKDGKIKKSEKYKTEEDD
ncbi:MAG: hypothetical protein WC868_02105 [Bacteroidales bacterium]